MRVRGLMLLSPAFSQVPLDNHWIVSADEKYKMPTDRNLGPENLLSGFLL